MVPKHRRAVGSVEVVEAVVKKKFVEVRGSSCEEEVCGTPWGCWKLDVQKYSHTPTRRGSADDGKSSLELGTVSL